MESEIDNDCLSVIQRCSNACTRSGMAALLFSSLLLALMNPIIKAVEYEALLSYSYHRHNVRISLEKLVKTPCWAELINEYGEKKLNNEWKLMDIKELTCFINISATNPVNTNSKKSSSEERKQNAKSENKTVPAAPTGLGVGYTAPLPYISNIINSLKLASETNNIRLARRYSNEYDYDIYEWETYKYNILKDLPVTPEERFRTGPGDSHVNIERIHAKYIDYLTLNQAKEISSIYMPDYKQLDENLNKFKIKLPTIPVSVSSTAAALFIQSGILLSVIYFWVFVSEAKETKIFHYKATLFGVFSRTFQSKVFFALLISMPCMSLAIYTLNPVLISLPSIIISIVSVALTFAILKIVYSELFYKIIHFKDLITGNAKL